MGLNYVHGMRYVCLNYGVVPQAICCDQIGFDMLGTFVRHPKRNSHI